MSNLKNKVIRLAYENPELRPALLPVLRSAAGTSEDITKNLPELRRVFVAYARAIDHSRRNNWTSKNLAFTRSHQQVWIQLVNAGLKVAEGILSTREIPTSKSKGFEMAYRMLSKAYKSPKDPYKWWKTNMKRLDLIIEGADRWPEKQLGGNQLFEVAGFTVHNIIESDPTRVESLKKTLEQAASLIKRNPIPGFSKVLYGDIYYVGQIRRSDTAAWYNHGEDILYVRPDKWGLDFVQTIIHELGHRYWRKFANSGTKAKWESHHIGVSYKKVEIDMPEVGDTLSIRVRGAPRGWRPTVKSIGQDPSGAARFYYETPEGESKYAPEYFILKTLKSSPETLTKKFPTAYSATSEEEHFCEALKLKAAGLLPDEHRIPFDAIWN